MDRERNTAQGKKPQSLRLTIHYEGDKVTLVSQHLVDMISLPSDPLEYSEKESGFWFVVKDNKEKTLYRRITQSPIQYAVEVRTNDPDRPLSWKTVDDPKGEFVLLLPAYRQAASVSLFSSPLSLKEARVPAKEFARISLERR